MSTEREPEFGLAKSFVFSILIITVILSVSEGAVRLWAYFLRDEIERFDPSAGTFVLVPGLHRTRYGAVKINGDGFVGAELAPDGPDLWRIVALGDSCTFGDGNDRGTYPAMLGERLGERPVADLRYEVVNAGISGLNSGLALRRLRSAVVPLEPDVVTVYVGWNDLMKFDPLSQGPGALASSIARFADHLYLVRGMRKLIFFHLRPRLWPPATGPESRTGRFAKFRPAYFEDNLREILETVEDLGARSLVATLPTVVRPGMTRDDLSRSGVIFPYFPSAYGVGDLAELIEAYNRSIRRVGSELHVPVVDLADRFAKLPDPTPYFTDTMHTTNRGMALIAEELEAALAANRLLGPERPTRVTEQGT